MPGSIGPAEIVIVLIVALIVFGPRRLPELGNGLGRGLREFKESVTGEQREEVSVRAVDAVEKPTPEPSAAPPDGA